MEASAENALMKYEQALAARVSQQELKEWIKKQARPYQELMSCCHCAMLQVETKFRVLNETLSLQRDYSPIEAIKTRLKTPESIIEKILRNDLPMTVESIEKHIHDIAGVRVICAFPSEIELLADAFLRQDDVTLLERKDYISTPKETGYRSLHLLVETPIYLHDQTKQVKVEVQLRTLAMDWWASLEHKIRYKNGLALPEELNQELLACSELSAALDKRMEEIKRSAKGENVI